MKIFDAHFHIIDPNYPLVANNGFMPDAFTVEQYQSTLKTIGVTTQGGAVVSGSFQAFDQGYLIAALQTFGENYVGVTNLSCDCKDDEILKLQQAGIRAVRFNLYRGGSEDVKNIESFAKRIYDLAGWHVELYVDSKDLMDLSPIMLRLPKVSIDHLGMSKIGFKESLALAAAGVHVKATGFMRVDFEVLPALKQLYDVNPDALMFGSDLPGTRAKRLFDLDDLKLITDNFDDA